MASAGSTASPRLLANLLTHEKEYAKALATLVDAGGAAGTALILYQPWLNHHGGGSEDGHGRSVLQSLALADVGLRTYAAAFESYVEGLKELRDLEDSVRNLIRDREILVTRVLKVSNKSSNRDSIFMTASPSHSTVSLDTLNGKSYALGGKSSKLPHWQAELHGCEAQLANAQRSLEAKRVSAVRDGLRLRATAMIECGTRWTEAGRAILQMNADAPLPPLPDISAQLDKPLPDDSSSLTPSQSASQTEADLDLYIPPAHSIADTGLPTSVPHVLSRRITEEELNENASSSSDEEAETEVVENPRFNATTSKRTKTSTAPSPTSPGDETPVRPRFFGTFRGFFSHKKTSSVNGDAEDPEEKLAKPRKARTWDTRTDKNIRKVDAIPSPSSPSASQIFDGATPRARRLRKNSPEKRTRRRSASVDGAIPDLSASAVWDDSTPVPATRKRSTKKKRVEGDLSPMSRLSRNDSITSAPATFSARAASPAPPLPTTPSNPSHKKQASLGTHGLTPTKTERRASLPPHQNASTSLMSIVEDVTRSNRMATMVTEDRGRERAISGGLVSVKAPQSLSRKEIDGLPMDSLLSGGRERTSSTVSVGGKQQQPKVTTLFEVKAPTSSTREALETLPAGSVVIASSMAPPSSPPPTRPSIIRSPPTSNGPPVVATSSTSSSSSSRPAPLRSALRNGGSRTPSPLSSAGREPSPPTSKLLVVHAPSPLHAVATAPALETAAERTSPPVKSGTSNVSPPPVASKTSSPPLEQERAHSPYLDDDTASISSYETTNEVFGDDNDATPTPPEKEYVVLTPGVSTTLPQTNGVNGTDVSASSDSTVASPPKRRKSVRVSLRPTFSPTPPAIEYDEWQPSEKKNDDDDGHGERNGRSWSSKDVEPPDMWQDSSDEDEQYSAARRLLNRVAKKEKKAKSS